MLVKEEFLARSRPGAVHERASMKCLFTIAQISKNMLHELGGQLGRHREQRWAGDAAQMVVRGEGGAVNRSQRTTRPQLQHFSTEYTSMRLYIHGI
jgi:hypothetical protein